MLVDFVAPDCGFAGASFPASQINGHDTPAQIKPANMKVRGTVRIAFAA
jgi:hypothetical protein